ncbi:hypothetical protein [Micromonospora sp. NPDC049891]|uniref:hypothetical protein n=1 Tax=Micromonospora sp. NPDC049891 TaxID=3155655 RepID=UPI0033CEB943
MAKHYDTVTSWNTNKTVEVTTSPAGRLTGTCSDSRCEPMTSAGGNSVMSDAREHLRWQHQDRL